MPRIDPVEKHQLPESYEIVERQRERLSDRIDSEFWNRQPTVRTFSNNPELGRAHVYTNTLMWTETGLEDAESEAVILSVARALDAAFLWHDHVKLALNYDRLTERQLLALANQDPGELEEPLRSLVAYVFDYVGERGIIDDSTHDSLAAQYDEGEIVGVVMLAGFYISLTHQSRALDLTADGFVGWHLENLDRAE
jgi:alkylhydroperoxidase family enzyme